MLGAITVTMLLLALVLTAPTPSAAATVGSQDRCRVAKSRTIVQNSRWRVYLTARPEERFYACSRRSERRRFVAHDDLIEAPSHFRLVGNVVAFAFIECDRYASPGRRQCVSSVVNIDLRRANRRHTPFVSGQLFRLELSTKRRYGFTVRRDDGTVAVYARDRNGLRVLEEAADIDPNSLRECGARLTWTRGRELHAARLV